MTDAVGDPVDQRAAAPPSFGTLGSAIYLLAITWAAAIGSFPLNDNSFFTHLATGRLILERGAVPSADPYTFTAHGEPWVVQSWLPSLLFAAAESLAGGVGLRIVVLAAYLGALTVIWRLTRPASSIVVRTGLTALSLLIGSGLWSERPYMVGVIGLGLVWLALDGRIKPWLLVPIMWVWVNSHGSWILAIGLTAAVLLGSALDRLLAGATARPTANEWRTAKAVIGGALLGAVGPLGTNALSFPLAAVTKSDVFSVIIEWQAPAFRSWSERAFLVLVVLTLAALIGRAACWRLALPSLAFAALAFYAQRNMVMAAVVLVAGVAHTAPELGTLRSWHRPRIGPVISAVTAVLAIAATLGAAARPPLGDNGLHRYPGHALAWLSSSGVRPEPAAEMIAGNLLEVLDGASGDVFFDDRVDMFPREVLQTYLDVDRGSVGWRGALERQAVKVLLWPRAQPIGSVVASDPQWRIAYSDAEWIVACRRDIAC